MAIGTRCVMAVPDPATCLELNIVVMPPGLINVPTYALIVAVPVCIVLNYLLVLGPCVFSAVAQPCL